ncbi:MAG: ABC transporter permease [Tannerella sp.]|jgi:putative ABC transport system permease protein|nr:ABC transporter permease [Tannerella sp.]
MFDFDSLREIGSTMKKNKLRTFLTGFSVAWGIFMLIVLLAAGNGLRNGIEHNFSDYSVNMMEVWTRYTTRPWQGLPSNRRLQFTEEEVASIRRDNPEVDLISPINDRIDTLAFNREYLTGRIYGVYPDFNKINARIKILSGNGRFVNDIDMKERRKVVVISRRMSDILFRDSIPPLGQHIRVGSLMFQVIGVYEMDNRNDTPPAYIPFSTCQALFEGGYRVGDIEFTVRGVNTAAESEAFEKRLRGHLARHLRFDPEDLGAIRVFSMGDEFRMWRGMNRGIALFIWIIGIGTLMAGIVGVSNIMLITVRERTREFGIRKAIGAKPSSILRLIIIESVLVTAAFGYVGMVSGIGLSEAINFVMEAAGTSGGGGNPGEGISLFRNPTVDMGIALSATFVLILAGVLAGYFPARKAVAISAIEAMREE